MPLLFQCLLWAAAIAAISFSVVLFLLFQIARGVNQIGRRIADGQPVSELERDRYSRLAPKLFPLMQSAQRFNIAVDRLLNRPPRS